MEYQCTPKSAKAGDAASSNTSSIDRCLDYILGGKAAAPPVLKPQAIMDTPVPPAANVGAAPPRPPLAIELPGYGQQANGAPPPPTIDSILAQARQTLEKRQKKAAKAGDAGKKGKKKNDKLPSSDDDDEDPAIVDERF